MQTPRLRLSTNQVFLQALCSAGFTEIRFRLRPHAAPATWRRDLGSSTDSSAVNLAMCVDARLAAALW